MRVLLVLALIFIYNIPIFGQTTNANVSLPTIIPASPEVAQLGKVGNISAGMHTGSANVSIPLYSMGVGKAKVDIAISYNSNGVKVDEIPSRVGLGWNLVAGGVISRTIHDDPDEMVAQLPPPSNPSSKDATLFNYLKTATDQAEDYDTEWDEFSYSFNGNSGKFFLNASGDGFCFPHNTLKIKATGYQYPSSHMSFTITTPDGVVYTFGTAHVEKTRNINIGGGKGGLVSKGAFYETAWFLESIKSPEGGTVTFNYSFLGIRSTLGPYQTLIKPIAADLGCGFNCSTTYSDQKGVNIIDYDTYCLSSIQTSTGITASLGYESRPDLSQDNRLVSLVVTAITGGVSSSIKRYGFEYLTPANNNSSLNKRYFLSKVKTYDTQSGDDANPANFIEHSFEYHQIESMPPRLSYQQDWFGYYNGAGNVNYFAPYIDAIAGSVVNPTNGADRNPDASGELRKVGILTKVVFPTGGTEEIIYERNTKYVSGQNVDACGVRVSEIRTSDPVSGKTYHKYYKYSTLADMSISSGEGLYKTISYVRYKTGTMICQGTSQARIAICDGYMISSSSLMPYHSYGGSHIAYKTVLESDDPDFKNGVTEHFFRTDPAASNAEFKCCDPDMTESLNFPANTGTVVDGTEYKTNFYKKASNGSYVLLKEVSTVTDIGAGVYNTKSNLIVRKRWKQNYEFNPPHTEEFDGYDVLEYKYVGQWIKLYSTTTKEYDENGANPVVNTVNYTYGNLSHLNPTQTDVLQSDGSTLSTQTKYPIDFAQASPINVYQKMVNINDINTPVETKTLKGTKEIGTVKSEQKIWNEASGILLTNLNYVATKKTAGESEDIRIKYHQVDPDGNVLEISKEGGTRLSYIYDYANTFPIAEIKNASITNDIVAYTSFEANGKGNWTFSGAPMSDATSPTGTKCYSLSNGAITRALNNLKTYLVSYWVKNGSGTITVSGISGTKQLTVKNGWTAYEGKVSGSSSISISGTATIDEIRLYPDGALMTTFTHLPYIGIQSTSAPNGSLTRYEYDGFGRLKSLKDGDGNILKLFDYAFKQAYTPCSNQTANWVSTGMERCKTTGLSYNYTGEKEREEQDLNNCSPTYLQKRWVVIGTPSECTPVPNCNAVDKRVIGNSCVLGELVVTYFAIINGTAYCTYHYEWLNGQYRSADLNAVGPDPCAY